MRLDDGLGDKSVRDIAVLLEQAVRARASDLHLTAGSPPIFRVHGALQVQQASPLSAPDVERIVRALLTSDQWAALAQRGECDFSYTLPSVSRYRVNVYRQRGCYSVAVRVVPTEVPVFASLGLPATILTLLEREHGLVLVTGPAGSGKSTTLAALIGHINAHQRKHIITLEDPIEYLHRQALSIIDQREIGSDTASFASGLRAALRQDPDVLLVGEMRDLETITTAITAAETGHLVLATLHTPDAPRSIDRMIDVFPPEQQQQIRYQLSAVLVGIVAQRLFPRHDGNDRVAAAEILLNTAAVANLIRSEKVHQIRSLLQTGRSFGMQSMELSVRELWQASLISEPQYRQCAAEWPPGARPL